MSNNYLNNDEQLVNEAGEIIFENIYKDCKSELKDQIITKLLSKIVSLNTKINSLEKENKKIKDNFLYVLKRILSSKEEYSNSSKQNNIITNYNTFKKSNRSRNKPAYTINLNNSLDYTNLNLTSLDSVNRSKRKFVINNSSDNLPLENLEEPQKSTTIEAKAKKYLNDLYRNNFDSIDGTPYSHFINKNISLYEELFPTSINKALIYKEVCSSYDTPKKRGNSRNNNKRNRSTGIRNKILIQDFDNIDQTYNKKKNNRNLIHRNYDHTPITDRRNASKERKHRNNYNIKNHNKNFQYNKIKTNRKNIEKNDSKKNNISFVKRSPYILNKF